MTCCCRKSNPVCFQAMHCLSASYHCVQLIIALLVPFQTARLSFKSTAMQFQLFLLTCIVSRPQHYLPKLLMSTAYLSIYDGIILSPPRTLPDKGSSPPKKTGKCGNFEKTGGGSTRIPLPCFTVFNMGEPPKKVLKCKKKT